MAVSVLGSVMERSCLQSRNASSPICRVLGAVEAGADADVAVAVAVDCEDGESMRTVISDAHL